MDSVYDISETFDVIFCRNVLIYFDRVIQEKVINRLCRHLSPDGYFFIGHSESLSGMDVPLDHVKPTIFKKQWTDLMLVKKETGIFNLEQSSKNRGIILLS